MNFFIKASELKILFAMDLKCDQSNRQNETYPSPLLYRT